MRISDWSSDVCSSDLVKVKPPAIRYFPMTDTPSFDTINLDVADHVATFTLNRPERLNSMPPAMADDIRAALDWMGVLGARALLITGEGRGFCSGADLAGDRTASAVGGGANSRKALR